MNWRPTYRWRRVRFGGVIALQGAVPGRQIEAHLDREARGDRFFSDIPVVDTWKRSRA